MSSKVKKSFTKAQLVEKLLSYEFQISCHFVAIFQKH